MINGAHAILYSDDAEATRAALVKVLGTRSVDASDGRLIFGLPTGRAVSTVRRCRRDGDCPPGRGDRDC
jgi:hypothetical protein